MSEALQVIQLEPLIEQIKALAPLFEKSLKAEAQLKARHDELTSLLEEWDGSQNDDVDQAIADAMSILALSKSAYDKWNGLRAAVTEPLDELKKQLMVPEKRVAYDGKTDNYYTAIKNTLAKAENIKLQRIKRQEQEAQSKKEEDQAKVDLQTQIRKNLANMVIERTVALDDWSKKHFDAATVDTFDAAIATYAAMKPGLKPALYDACFTKVIIPAKLSSDATKWSAIVDEMKQVETFDKWNEFVIQGMMPILNGWRAKEAQMRQEKITIAEAKGEELRKLQEQKEARDREEQERKDKEALNAKALANQAIDQDAEMNKMESEFQQQAVVQNLEQAGPKKKVLRFVDDKNIVKALASVMAHCLINPKYPGIYKTDKNKVIVEKDGFKVYRDEIDWFMNFFAQYCDADVPGTKLEEVAKIIIRK